mmetsp:Transcript_17924/g.44416  ORF Transcript_17924/g.44416 Transcript_17924/m.44416 type:complete len:210 (+) Transcript_17924:333-962(+)
MLPTRRGLLRHFRLRLRHRRRDGRRVRLVDVVPARAVRLRRRVHGRRRREVGPREAHAFGAQVVVHLAVLRYAQLRRPLFQQLEGLLPHASVAAPHQDQLAHLRQNVLRDHHHVKLVPAVLHAHLQGGERQHLSRGVALHDLGTQSLHGVLAEALEVGVDQVAQVHVHAPVGTDEDVIRRLLDKNVGWGVRLVVHAEEAEHRCRSSRGP